MAVWALDTQATISRSKNLEFIRVPGGNNANVVAQAGMFTLLRQNMRGGVPLKGRRISAITQWQWEANP